MSKEPEPTARHGPDELLGFQQIVEAHRERIYRLALAMTGSRAEAEDVTQDVFLSAYRSRATFRGDAAVGTWLYRIAVNVSLSTLARRRGRSERAMEGEAPGDSGWSVPVPQSPDDPERSAEASLLEETIKRALLTLTPRERAVFALRHYEDLPLKEVAAALAIRLGTVKSLLWRAVTKLQRELSAYRKE